MCERRCFCTTLSEVGWDVYAVYFTIKSDILALTKAMCKIVWQAWSFPHPGRCLPVTDRYLLQIWLLYYPSLKKIIKLLRVLWTLQQKETSSATQWGSNARTTHHPKASPWQRCISASQSEARPAIQEVKTSYLGSRGLRSQSLTNRGKSTGTRKLRNVLKLLPNTSIWKQEVLRSGNHKL